MNSKKRESSPSTEPSGRSQKREKSDVTDDSSVSSLLTIAAQPTDLTHSNKSYFSAATKARFEKIRSAREVLDNMQQKICEDVAKVYCSADKSLKSQVMKLRKCLKTAETALEAAKSELSRVNIENDDKIKELEVQAKRDSEKVKAAVAEMIQVRIEKEQKIKELEEAAKRDTETLEAAINRLIELRQNAMPESSCQEQLKLKEMELKEAKEKISKLEAEKKSLREEVQELLPKAQRAKELEKKLQSFTEVPPKAVQVVKPCKSSDVEEKIKQQVMPVECEALSPMNVESDSKTPTNLLTLPKSRVNSLGKQSQKGKKESQKKCKVPQAKEREVAKGNTELDPKIAKNETSVPVIKKDPLIQD